MATERRDVGLHGPDNLDDKFTSKYIDLPLGPRFAFGHGLSYTTFAVSDVALSDELVTAAQLRAGKVVEVNAVLTNTGARAGDDVVFVYLTDPVASVTQPVQRLRGFKRVHLAAGEATTVRFTFGARDLGFWNDRDEFLLETGELILTVTDGTNAAELALRIE